ncbi:hypothetical protein KGP17_26650 [Serratia sp. JSRIV001]|nr:MULTISPECIES: hypothetical protein [Serratia]MBP0998303.1 hypothetical protein [Serratia fonticola]MBP1003655.1 hypothetical protein [Serratia fonticola]MBP1013258.1 hypothetical protein [Serratia fonticola]MBP1018467.1 hypothetical protein [Serratia fonticola]PAA98757.1 hypothetical protein CJJ13_04815 [Serratia fonticola]
MDYNQSSNEVLAKYFDAFIEKASGALRDGVRDIETGAIRSLALISPQVSIGYTNPQYMNLISAHSNMIREEDSRMLRSIFSLVKKPNVIYEMTLTIVNFVFATMPERTKKNLTERRSEIEDKVTDTIAKQAIKAAAKIALIEVLVQLITLRISSSPDVIISSRQVVARMLTAFQIYSYFDKAAVAARALRRENRVIYNMLYSQEVEMLYFIIAKKIDPLIKVSLSNDSTNADALMFALADVFYKR